MINNKDETQTNKIEYRLLYKYDSDDMDPRYYYSDHPINAGDVIHSDSFYHLVLDVTQQKTGVRLLLAKSAQSPEEARLLAQQMQ